MLVGREQQFLVFAANDVVLPGSFPAEFAIAHDDGFRAVDFHRPEGVALIHFATVQFLPLLAADRPIPVDGLVGVYVELSPVHDISIPVRAPGVDLVRIGKQLFEPVLDEIDFKDGKRFVVFVPDLHQDMVRVVAQHGNDLVGGELFLPFREPLVFLGRHSAAHLLHLLAIQADLIQARNPVFLGALAAGLADRDQDPLVIRPRNPVDTMISVLEPDDRRHVFAAKRTDNNGWSAIAIQNRGDIVAVRGHTGLIYDRQVAEAGEGQPFGRCG